MRPYWIGTPPLGIVGKRVRDTISSHGGAMKSFRAPQANFKCFFTSSVTLRASWRRCEQAWRLTELLPKLRVLGRGGRCSLPVCGSSHPVYPSSRDIHGAYHIETRRLVGDTVKRFAEQCACSYSRDGRTLRQGISIGRKGSASKASQSACLAIRSPSARSESASRAPWSFRDPANRFAIHRF